MSTKHHNPAPLAAALIVAMAASCGDDDSGPSKSGGNTGGNTGGNDGVTDTSEVVGPCKMKIIECADTLFCFNKKAGGCIYSRKTGFDSHWGIFDIVATCDTVRLPSHAIAPTNWETFWNGQYRWVEVESSLGKNPFKPDEEGYMQHGPTVVIVHDGVRVTPGCFTNCKRLHTIHLGKDVSFEWSDSRNYTYFEGCDNVREVIIDGTAANIGYRDDSGKSGTNDARAWQGFLAGVDPDNYTLRMATKSSTTAVRKLLDSNYKAWKEAQKSSEK